MGIGKLYSQIRKLDMQIWKKEVNLFQVIKKELIRDMCILRGYSRMKFSVDRE